MTSTSFDLQGDHRIAREKSKKPTRQESYLSTGCNAVPCGTHIGPHYSPGTISCRVVLCIYISTSIVKDILLYRDFWITLYTYLCMYDISRINIIHTDTQKYCQFNKSLKNYLLVTTQIEIIFQ